MPEGTEAGPGAARPEARAAGHGERPGASGLAAASLVPESGWHFLHLYYQVDRGIMAGLDAATRRMGREQVRAILGEPLQAGLEQRQCFVTPGHRSDFGLMLAGPDVKAIRGVQTAIACSALGTALRPSYSFYSITEVSEYVPDAEQYGRILRERERMDPESAAYRTKVAQYANRLEGMNRQRLYPEFPDWPCMCFYPMSKSRLDGQNWYMLPFEERNRLMAEHGRSGMAFAGRVTQVITASTGLDDWEWGVTLWGRNPAYLKDIVYTMRFDEASAKYAVFGPFYFGYITPPEELLDAIGL